MAVIKALSLWQPWASLIAWGAKEFETRSWPTNYRGKLAIHAAKRKPTAGASTKTGTGSTIKNARMECEDEEI